MLKPFTHKTIDRAASWLFHSGIIDRRVGSPTFGAFHYGYAPMERSFLQTYSEITGYGISLLIQLHRLNPDSPCLNLAINAAKHLFSTQLGKTEGEGAFSHGFLPPDHRLSNDYYSFDAGICLSGLADLYREISWEPALGPIVKAANWLTDKAQNEDGSFKSRFDLKQNAFTQLPQAATWYRDNCCLHSKNAIGLLKAAEITSHNHYRDAAIKALDWVLSLQRLDGAFPIMADKLKVYTHAHCYVLEALMYASSVLEKDLSKKYREAAMKGAIWLLTAQNQNGSFHRWYPETAYLSELITDATAQTVRIWLNFTDQIPLHRINLSLNYLTKQQWLRGPLHLKGSFISKRYKMATLSIPALKVMCWPTLFAIHAYVLEQSVMEGKKARGSDIF